MKASYASGSSIETPSVSIVSYGSILCLASRHDPVIGYERWDTGDGENETEKKRKEERRRLFGVARARGRREGLIPTEIIKILGEACPRDIA